MFRSIIHFALHQWAALLITVFALVGVPMLAQAQSGTTYTVKISEDGFSPSRLAILVGDSIEFLNAGELDHWPASNIHPTHELYPDLDARRPILPGGSWTFTFLQEGSWGFHDHLNPQNTAEVDVLVDPDEALVDRPASSDPTSRSGLARLYESARMFLARIFYAVQLFVAETFQSSSVSSDPASEVNTEFRPPPEVDFETIYLQAVTGCLNDDFDCFEEYFRGQVISSGPEIAVELVNRLREDGTVSTVVDEHQLAHRIGRQTAETYGINEQAFLLCPMESLNGGCQHGFFEFALGRTESSSAAADLICQSLKDGYSSKFQFYCYHGVGHGVMMAAAYDLTRALDECDTFGTSMAQDGCWQGVFMENVSAGMGNFARNGVFSDVDPLAPCDGLAGQYQHQCYINHAGYLMTFYNNDVESATNACLQAEDDDISSCLQSIGLMVTNPVWQINFIEDLETIAFEDASWQICLMFPGGYLDECVLGAIDNVLNFDALDLTRAKAFCNTVFEEYRLLCYQRMGFNLSNQVVDLKDARELCAQLADEFESVCLFGAGIGVES